MMLGIEKFILNKIEFFFNETAQFLLFNFCELLGHISNAIFRKCACGKMQFKKNCVPKK